MYCFEILLARYTRDVNGNVLRLQREKTAKDKCKMHSLTTERILKNT